MDNDQLLFEKRNSVEILENDYAKYAVVWET